MRQVPEAATLRAGLRRKHVEEVEGGRSRADAISKYPTLLGKERYESSNDEYSRDVLKLPVPAEQHA